jgi:hypothetical protein
VPSDKIQTSATISNTAKFTSAAGSLDRFELTGSGNASVLPAPGGASACSARQSAALETTTVFTVTKPGWLSIDGSVSGTPNTAAAPGEYFTWLYINRSAPTVAANTVDYNTTSYGGQEVSSQQTKSSTTIFLEAGQYWLQNRVYVRATTVVDVPSGAPAAFAASSTRSASFSFKGAFRPAGAKDGKAVSVTKGKKYVKLLDRSCATDNVTAKLSKKKLKNASKVVFSVNGKKKKTVKLSKKFPKNGLVQVGPIPDTTEAVVKARIFLKAKGADKPTLEQSYLACS